MSAQNSREGTKMSLLGHKGFTSVRMVFATFIKEENKKHL